MSEKTGWLFSVGRIFSGSKDREVNGKSSKTSPKTTTSSPKALETATFLKDVVSLEGEGTSQSPSQVKRNATLRYLSPTIADRSSRRTITNGLESSEDIFNSPLLAKRKRQMTDSDSLFLVNVTGNAAKRSKSVANRSLLEQPSQKSQGALTRHDTTWSGGLSASHSPASSVTSFSLLSKQSVPKSNGSDLSTSTMRILKQLEKVQTPAREIQRMPMIRTANRVGTWAEGPPLKKAVDATPSRIQLLSKTMGISARRKPYWQDLTRKRSEKTTVDGVEAIPNGSSDLDKTANDPSVLHELFKTTVPEKSLSSTESGKKHQSVLKGSDGKSIGLNTFNAASLDDFEPVSKSWMNNVKPIADKTAAPASGFLSTLSFSFTAPTQVTAESIIAVKKNAESKVSDDSDSDGSETSVGEKDSGSDSDDSDSDSDTEKAPKKTDASRPQTSTDTVSDGATPASSKNSSPAGETNKVAVAVTTTAKNWDCPECFTNWPQDKESCGCCGYNKSGSSSKKLVSTLDLTASKPPATTVKFGFGASAPVSNTPAAPAQSLFEFSKPVSSSIPPFGSKPAEKEKEEPKVEKPKETTVLAASAAADWSCPDCFVQNKATSEKCVCCSHVNAAAAAPPRAAWGCPDCMVTNKAECDNCVCCGYAMYKTAGSEKKSNSVFGDRAFKPNTAAPAGVSFGFGKPADANKTAAPAVKFGFGTGPAPVKAEEKKEEPVKPAAVFSIGKPEETVTDGAKTEKPEEKKPLFGTSTSTAPLFGSGSLFGGSVSKPAEAPAPAAASETVSKSTVFAFGKPDAPAKIEVVQTAAPAAAPLFGSSTVSFGAPTATAAQAPAPAVVPPTAASQPTSTPFSFGSTSNSSSGLFGSSSAATTSSTPFVFGSTTAAAPAPAAPVAAPAPAPVAPAPLSFGSFGTSTATAAPATTNLFGAAPAATSSAPSGGLFGSSSTPSISTGLFGSSSTTAASSIAPASNNTTSLFGNAQSSAPLFGAPEAKKSMFGTSETAAQPVAPMFGSFGASTTTNNAFNFGSTAAPAGDVFKFGSSSSSTSAAPAPVFQFGQPPAPIPTLSTSSSTNSMFNLPTEAPKEFNFGAPPASDGGAFQFGAASSGSLFNPGPPTSVPGLRSNTATRKMAVARRRRQ